MRRRPETYHAATLLCCVVPPQSGNWTEHLNFKCKIFSDQEFLWAHLAEECSNIDNESACNEACLTNTHAFNRLKPTGHVMHQQFNIQQLYALPALYLCVLYLSENRQRLVPLTV
jgi:hypothetical protein